MNENLNKIIKHPAFIPSIVGVLSFGAGTAAGYILGRKLRPGKEIQYHDAPESGIDVSAIEEEETPVQPKVVVPPVVIDAEDYEKLVREEGYRVENEEVDDPNVVITIGDDLVRHTVFAKNDEDWDHEREVAERNSIRPYVIHKDEFYAEEMADEGFTQITLSYYNGDNIMCDQEDTPVVNFEQIVGPLLFGHGSAGDPRVFYVRNEKRKGEYEIIFNEGHYAVDVQGLELEDHERARDLKHSQILKFRDD